MTRGRQGKCEREKGGQVDGCGPQVRRGEAQEAAGVGCGPRSKLVRVRSPGTPGPDTPHHALPSSCPTPADPGELSAVTPPEGAAAMRRY